jgi:hypothetical protein
MSDHTGELQLYCRRSDREQAQEHLTTAMAMYREIGMAYWLGRLVAHQFRRSCGGSP